MNLCVPGAGSSGSSIGGVQSNALGCGPSFDTLASPVYRFANETPDRVPLTDWYWTHNGKRRGFQARSVVGGVFIKMLADRAIWNRRASRARQR